MRKRRPEAWDFYEIGYTAKRLRQLRRRMRLTQREFAERSGIGMQTISTYECGARTETIPLLHLVAICRALGITLSQFFDFGEMDRAIDRR